MTELLSARIAAGTATNEDIAPSRGWKCVEDEDDEGDLVTVWRWNGLGKWQPSSWHPPDYLNDIRLTLADIEAKGWLATMYLLSGGKAVADVVANGKGYVADAATAATALLIAYAKAQEAEEAAPTSPPPARS